MSAAYELIHPNVDIIRYRGIMSTCGGSASIPMTLPTRSDFPRTVFRASPYATRKQLITLAMVTELATSNEFAK